MLVMCVCGHTKAEHVNKTAAFAMTANENVDRDSWGVIGGCTVWFEAVFDKPHKRYSPRQPCPCWKYQPVTERGDGA
jgi:hypothetical protein